ncbi:uncharacterized protein CANTADRAFT_6365 [Suhomyces tanzawaensis NRRL Y-17324]|uniref:Uncharacterized protein n=1 Tax=Suhomyces tanzawaensis NRRL Y-17324 TaxID=984487 RepID=A0A1E4SI99_9ASCO|nr:uncharacterized protein CANTADRAFT_6365 [Suhomyces tanzawaensis NRRL Y-17324]ODV79200.1 hypothetical protein CANTADRAFT_6365 [Suhomyces tanzawaensis NRRL Y-17324]
MSNQRRCSLALESTGNNPGDPLNAYLVYNTQLSKCKSVPDLTKEASVSFNSVDNHHTKRRVSLCDLNNLDQQLETLRGSAYTTTAMANSTQCLVNHKSNPRPSYEGHYSPPTGCRRHQRRKSVAMKFENPRVV